MEKSFPRKRSQYGSKHAQGNRRGSRFDKKGAGSDGPPRKKTYRGDSNEGHKFSRGRQDSYAKGGYDKGKQNRKAAEGGSPTERLENELKRRASVWSRGPQGGAEGRSFDRPRHGSNTPHRHGSNAPQWKRDNRNEGRGEYKPRWKQENRDEGKGEYKPRWKQENRGEGRGEYKPRWKHDERAGGRSDDRRWKHDKPRDGGRDRAYGQRTRRDDRDDRQYDRELRSNTYDNEPRVREDSFRHPSRGRFDDRRGGFRGSVVDEWKKQNSRDDKPAGDESRPAGMGQAKRFDNRGGGRKDSGRRDEGRPAWKTGGHSGARREGPRPGGEGRSSDHARSKRSSERDDTRGVARARGKSKPPRKPAAAREEIGEMRLNRFLAMAGVAARRKADELIASGIVRVDGVVITQLGTKVDPRTQEVTVNGTPATIENRLVYILLNKPKDCITTTSDEKDRATVMDLIPDSPVVYPVGRLDRNTTGVLLLTNDGDLAYKLTHPSFEVARTYVATLKDKIPHADVERLRSGVELEDGVTSPCQVDILDAPNDRVIGLVLHEGKNREVRRMFEALGHTLAKLERVDYAGLTNEGLKRGGWRYLDEHEVERLKKLVKGVE
jgi:23S rRNA pseudouridine2605 synthase